MGNTHQDIECIRELLDAFHLERIVNIVMACLALVAQLVFVVLFADVSSLGPTVAGILAAPSGLLITTMGRVLKMWSDSLRFLRQVHLQEATT
jgi:hypothetical protein